MKVVGQVNFDYANYQVGYDVLSQDKSTNSSRVRFYGVFNTYNRNYYWDSGTAGVWNTYVPIGTYYAMNGSYTLVSEDVTLYHDQNGEYKNGYLSGSLNTSYIKGTAKGYFTLPKIERIINVTNATDFNDETNTTITFNNPLNFKGQPNLRFGRVNDTTEVLLELTREKNYYYSPYTFELTNEERNQIRQIMNNNTQYDVYVGFYTYDDNDVYQGLTWKKQSFSIINAEPDYTYRVEETNQKVINVLGTTANKSVKGISNLKFTINPILKKQAIIKSVAFGQNTTLLSKKQSPFVFEITPQQKYFYVNVLDSRNLSKSGNPEITCLDYEPISINNFKFERLNPTSSDIRITIDANYFQSTYGSTANIPLIKWKLEDGNFNTINDYTIDTDNNKLIVNTILNDVLSYENQGLFTLEIEDLFSVTTDKQTVIKGIPVVEIGEEDVQTNGDLYIADKNGENPINIKDIVKQIYSNDEVVVGEYLGKPLYRKVVDCGYLPNNAIKNVIHGISNAEYVTIKGTASDGASAFPLPRVHPSTNLSISLEINGTNITLYDQYNFSSYKAEVTLEYTKTTD